MRPRLVFTGPTLSHPEAQQVADVICLPPAVQGSIVAAVQRYDPAAIVIIDGAFQAEPAVRHKEILWAISQAIPVIGAGSMGALRAAELYPYMHGVGLIYRWYRRFAFLPDDAVAVLYGPEG
ncbi:MAG: TfuA domain-containing protein, partial [Mesorhizobium sp.]